MRKTNRASSGFTAVQVGKVVPPDDAAQEQPTPPKGKRTPGRTVNIRRDNATVGRQANVIVGDLHIEMPR